MYVERNRSENISSKHRFDSDSDSLVQTHTTLYKYTNEIDQYFFMEPNQMRISIHDKQLQS